MAATTLSSSSDSDNIGAELIQSFFRVHKVKHVTEDLINKLLRQSLVCKSFVSGSCLRKLFKHYKAFIKCLAEQRTSMSKRKRVRLGQSDIYTHNSKLYDYHKNLLTLKKIHKKQVKLNIRNLTTKQKVSKKITQFGNQKGYCEELPLSCVASYGYSVSTQDDSKFLNREDLRSGKDVTNIGMSPIYIMRKIYRLCRNVSQIVLNQEVVLDISPPVYVIGDIHGLEYDLQRLLIIGGMPPESKYLFLGNYSKFGYMSIAGLCLLLALKKKYPENIYLLRGNEECSTDSGIIKFYDECTSRFKKQVWKSIVNLFDCLPFVAVVGGKMFCCHGGIPTQPINIVQVKTIERPIKVFEDGALRDIIWSDPSKRYSNKSYHEKELSESYSSEAIFNFFKSWNQLGARLELVCRGNRIVRKGFCVSENERMVTLSSATECSKSIYNVGAIMGIASLSQSDMLCTFRTMKLFRLEQQINNFFGITSKFHQYYMFKERELWKPNWINNIVDKNNLCSFT